MHVYTGHDVIFVAFFGSTVNKAWSSLDPYQINQGKSKQALSWGRDGGSHDAAPPTPGAGGGRASSLPLKVANCWLQLSSSGATHSPTPNSLSLLKAQLSSAKILFWAIIFNICPISILEYSYTSIISLWQEQGAFALRWQMHTEGRDMTCTQEDLQLFFPCC